jgi:prepilin-type N-terminal cleavage/methylation domain-containing protein
MNANHSLPSRRGAFTLIEMLVVIAIIGILAGMFIGIYPGIKEKAVRKRVATELASLVVAIENYKHDQGFYPPDNRNNVAQPPLYYELVGCGYDATSKQFVPVTGAQPVPAAAVKNAFGVDGFVNTSTGKPSKNYLPDLRDNHHGITTNTPVPVELLLAPYKGPDGEFNAWRYNSSSPEHNPGSYDLWAEITLGNKTVNIGNWR